MDTFILVATSFTIAVSLMITGKTNRLQSAFAALCAAVFVSQTAVTLENIFHYEFLLKIKYLGSLAIAPAALRFFHHLTKGQSIILRKFFSLFMVVSLCGVVFVFLPLSEKTCFHNVIAAYVLFSLMICYLALLGHVGTLPSGTEKRRFGYLLVFCPVALILSYLDLLNFWGFSLLKINGMVSSALLYFILLIIAYPQLLELHDFLARSLVILLSTLAGAAIFYFTVSFFNGDPPLTGLLMASFLVVISLSPMRMIFRKIFGVFYPDSKDIFTSLYEFDEKLEREKALMLEEMAPVLAHEIRNPLGSIKGAAQYLKTEASTGEHKELLDVIVEGTDRLNTVVSKFLDYARPYQLQLKTQDINAIIRRAISVIAANKLLEHITIVEDLEDKLPFAAVDEQQCLQVVLNIALNAIEAMPQGGTLTFCTSSQKSETAEDLALTIRDTGTGIDQKYVKDIFKPFFTTKERGVGLGLAICQKIIREHNGRISVQSIASQGTTVVIQLKRSG